MKTSAAAVSLIGEGNEEKEENGVNEGCVVRKGCGVNEENEEIVENEGIVESAE